LGVGSEEWGETPVTPYTDMELPSPSGWNHQRKYSTALQQYWWSSAATKRGEKKKKYVLCFES